MHTYILTYIHTGRQAARPGQTRQDKTRPDQTRSDQTRQTDIHAWLKTRAQAGSPRRPANASSPKRTLTAEPEQGDRLQHFHSLPVIQHPGHQHRPCPNLQHLAVLALNFFRDSAEFLHDLSLHLLDKVYYRHFARDPTRLPSTAASGDH